MIGKVILLSLLGAAYSSHEACIAKCFDVMGCGPGTCGDVWENCCNKYSCDWAAKCDVLKIERVKTKAALHDCQVLNGHFNRKEDSISCKHGYWLNPAFEANSDFACINGQARWKYDAGSKSGVPIPSFPICAEFGVSPNSAEVEDSDYTPVWSLCSSVGCFNAQGSYKKQNEACSDLGCSAFNTPGLKQNTGKCCVDSDAPSGKSCHSQYPNKAAFCSIRGCGSKWECARDDDAESG